MRFFAGLPAGPKSASVKLRASLEVLLVIQYDRVVFGGSPPTDPTVAVRSSVLSGGPACASLPMAEETKEAQDTIKITKKPEVSDWSTHTYGGLGSLHNGKKLLHDPKGQAEACTFATMKRRTTEQRAWRPISDGMRRIALQHFPVDPRAVPGGTMLVLGQTRDTRLVTTYLDTTYTFFALITQTETEKTKGKPLVNIYVLSNHLVVPFEAGGITQLSEGEYLFTLPEDMPPVALMLFPLLKNNSEGNSMGMESASRKLRTCAACGQVWRRSMMKCAGCNEVPYCSRVCQRHHWSSHKAACKRTRSQRKGK